MRCPYCDRQIADGSEKCEYCGLAIGPEEEPEVQEVKKPNIWLGTLGGLLGALIGGGLFFLAIHLGGLLGTFVGMLLSVFVLVGYRLLGRRLTRGGIMISMALIAVTTYLVDRLDWAYRVMTWQVEQVFDTGAQQLDVFGAFTLVPSLIDTGNIDFSSYLINLAVMYVFCAVGAYYTLRTLLKNQ